MPLNTPDKKAEPDGGQTPTARAIEWTGRIMGVSLVMILPGLCGQWLDKKLGTQFLTLIGFGLGLTAGIGALLVMTKPRQTPRK